LSLSLSPSATRFARLSSCVISCSFIFLIAFAHASTTNYYVSPSGSDANNGLDASTPLLNIRYAVDTAAANDHIWLMAGAHVVDRGARAVNIDQHKPLTIRAQSSDATVTTVTCAGGVGPAFGIHSTTTIHGFTIEHCGTTYGGGLELSSPDAQFTITKMIFRHLNAHAGGAIAINAAGASALEVHNSTFTNCTAPLGYGGAIFGAMTSKIVLENNTFSDCFATDGGAIGLHFTKLTVTRNMFVNCSSIRAGGAATITHSDIMLNGNTWSKNRVVFGSGSAVMIMSSDVAVDGDTFEYNTAAQDGTLALRFAGVATAERPQSVVNSIFRFNSAGNRGGGLFSSENTNILVSNSTFSGNEAVQGGGINLLSCKHGVVKNSTFIANSILGDGSGMYARCEDKQVTVSHSRFISNSAARGGGLYVCLRTTAHLGALQFMNNTATRGAGLFFSKSMTSVDATDLYFKHNRATSNGGGMTGDSLSFTLQNSEFVENTAPLGPAIYLAKPTSHALVHLTFVNNHATVAGAASQMYYESLNSVVDSSDSICRSCTFTGLSRSMTTDPMRIAITSPLSSSLYAGRMYPITFNITDGLGQAYQPSSLNAKITLTARYLGRDVRIPHGSSIVSQFHTNKVLPGTSQPMTVSDDPSESSAFAFLGLMGGRYELKFTAEVLRGSPATVSKNITVAGCDDNSWLQLIIQRKQYENFQYDICESTVPIAVISQLSYWITFSLSLIVLLYLAALWLIMEKLSSLPVFMSSSVPFLRIMLLGSVPAVVLAMLVGSDAVSTDDPRGDAVKLIDSYSVLCPVQPMLVLVSFATIMGSLLVRTSRIAKIFNATSLVVDKSKLSNKHLSKRLAGIVFVAFVFSLIWATVDPLHIEPELDESGSEYWLACNSHYNTIWLPIAFTGVILLIARALQLAISIRNVESMFNESRQIAFAVYNMTMVIIVAVPLLSTVSKGDAAHLVTTLSLLFGVASTVSIIMLPKVYIAIMYGEDYNPHENSGTQMHTASQNDMRPYGSPVAASARKLGSVFCRGPSVTMPISPAQTPSRRFRRIPKMSQLLSPKVSVHRRCKSSNDARNTSSSDACSISVPFNVDKSGSGGSRKLQHDLDCNAIAETDSSPSLSISSTSQSRRLTDAIAKLSDLPPLLHPVQPASPRPILNVNADNTAPLGLGVVGVRAARLRPGASPVQLNRLAPEADSGPELRLPNETESDPLLAQSDRIARQSELHHSGSGSSTRRMPSISAVSIAPSEPHCELQEEAE
jgi:7 transmembrane sweet-taste receptor of 3 GCPR/Right handed beta helix region